MNQLDRHTQAAAHPTAYEGLTPLVCWTRMQAEAGQRLGEIFARKELERQAGEGLFCWGVGNAPSTIAPTMAKAAADIDLVFSVMKSRPKPQDVSPAALLAWRCFVDSDGVERNLPRNVLITSRADTATGQKRSHYALMARSERSLQLGDAGAFDPGAFRNVGGAGGQIGASQVTALLRRVAPNGPTSDYRINFKAKLTGSYWVKLCRPVVLAAPISRQLDGLSTEAASLSTWLELVEMIRELPSVGELGEQPRLL